MAHRHYTICFKSSLSALNSIAQLFCSDHNIDRICFSQNLRGGLSETVPVCSCMVMLFGGNLGAVVFLEEVCQLEASFENLKTLFQFYFLCFMIVVQNVNSQLVPSAAMSAACCHASSPSQTPNPWNRIPKINSSPLKLSWLWCFITAI